MVSDTAAYKILAMSVCYMFVRLTNNGMTLSLVNFHGALRPRHSVRAQLLRSDKQHQLRCHPSHLSRLRFIYEQILHSGRPIVLAL